MTCEKCGEGGRQPVITSLFEYKYSDSSPFTGFTASDIDVWSRPLVSHPDAKCFNVNVNVPQLNQNNRDLVHQVQTFGRPWTPNGTWQIPSMWRERIADIIRGIKGKVLNLPKTLKLNNDASSGWVYILWGSWIFTLKFMECLSVRKGED